MSDETKDPEAGKSRGIPKLRQVGKLELIKLYREANPAKNKGLAEAKALSIDPDEMERFANELGLTLKTQLPEPETKSGMLEKQIRSMTDDELREELTWQQANGKTSQEDETHAPDERSELERQATVEDRLEELENEMERRGLDEYADRLGSGSTETSPLAAVDISNPPIRSADSGLTLSFLARSFPFTESSKEFLDRTTAICVQDGIIGIITPQALFCFLIEWSQNSSSPLHRFVDLELDQYFEKPRQRATAAMAKETNGGAMLVTASAEVSVLLSEALKISKKLRRDSIAPEHILTAYLLQGSQWTGLAPDQAQRVLQAWKQEMQSPSAPGPWEYWKEILNVADAPTDETEWVLGQSGYGGSTKWPRQKRTENSPIPPSIEPEVVKEPAKINDASDSSGQEAILPKNQIVAAPAHGREATTPSPPAPSNAS